MSKDILNNILTFSKFPLKSKKSKREIDRENSELLIESVKIWVQRMNKNAFHGGDIPDAADFRLYSMVRRFTACRRINLTFKKYVKIEAAGINVKLGDVLENDYKNIFTNFDDWLSRMFILCNRSSFYNLREVGYNYNKYLSDEIIEQEKITKPLRETQNDSSFIKRDMEEMQDTNNQGNSLKENNNRKNIMGVFGNKIKRNKINI